MTKKVKKQMKALSKEEAKLRLKKIEYILVKWQGQSVEAKSQKQVALRTWRQIAMAWRALEDEKREQERQRALNLLGKEVASFRFKHILDNNVFEMDVQVSKIEKPDYFKITLSKLSDKGKVVDKLSFKSLIVPGLRDGLSVNVHQLKQDFQ